MGFGEGRLFSFLFSLLVLVVKIGGVNFDKILSNVSCKVNI